jgi:hypothetical protein
MESAFQVILRLGKHITQTIHFLREFVTILKNKHVNSHVFWILATNEIGVDVTHWLCVHSHLAMRHSEN